MLLVLMVRSWMLPRLLIVGAVVVGMGVASPPTGRAVQLEGTVLRTETLKQGRSADLTQGPVSVKVQLRSAVNADGRQGTQAVATVRVKGEVVGVLEGPESPVGMNGAAEVQIVNLDPANVYPEVLLSAFTGGAHCCNQMQVLTRPAGQQAWRAVQLGPFDGGPAPARTPYGGTVPLIVSSDNRFLYQFACYACGRAPTRLWQLKGDQFVDVSHQPRYRPLYRRELESYQELLDQPRDPEGNPNGWLAAYVATKALVGERQQGWQQMLERYSATSDWGLKACLGGYGTKGCRTPEVVYPNYPEALKAFLQRTGYWN